MIALVDYGLGNLQNVVSALSFLNLEFSVDIDGSTIRSADICLIPGVAAFGQGMRGLEQRGQVEAIRSFAGTGKPLVGLCLGAQMLFESSEESPGVAGLGIVKGTVKRLDSLNSRVPNQGWAKVRNTLSRDSQIKGLDNYFYFSHSFEMKPTDSSSLVATITDSASPIAALVRQENVTCIQFHPERSGQFGLELLKNILEKAS